MFGTFTLGIARLGGFDVEMFQRILVRIEALAMVRFIAGADTQAENGDS
jgi:hypothetical protein